LSGGRPTSGVADAFVALAALEGGRAGGLRRRRRATRCPRWDCSTRDRVERGFPAPLGPMRPPISRSLTTSDTSSAARRAPTLTAVAAASSRGARRLLDFIAVLVHRRGVGGAQVHRHSADPLRSFFAQLLEVRKSRRRCRRPGPLPGHLGGAVVGDRGEVTPPRSSLTRMGEVAHSTGPYCQPRRVNT